VRHNVRGSWCCNRSGFELVGALLAAPAFAVAVVVAIAVAVAVEFVAAACFFR